MFTITNLENDCWIKGWRFGYAFTQGWYRCGGFLDDGCDSGNWTNDYSFSYHDIWELGQ